MPYTALEQLRQNIAALLRERKEDQKTLAFTMGRHPTTINKFLKGSRELQLADLDKIAQFFGLATYQLFQPGISSVTERRQGRDRRSGRDRRVGHIGRQLHALSLQHAHGFGRSDVVELSERITNLSPEIRAIVRDLVGLAETNPRKLTAAQKRVQKA